MRSIKGRVKDMDHETSLEEKFRNQPLGTHLCCIYRSKDEQMTALSSFMKIGVERNEKCLYIVDDRTKQEVIDAFKDQDFDLEEVMKTNQFEFMTKSETYLKDGFFDPDKMIGLLEDAMEKALKEDYSGLRVTGEMTWFFSDMPGVENLMEYESKLNDFIPDNDIMALCQYNENKFSPAVLVDVIRTHPKMIIYDDLYRNHYFMPPKIFTKQMKGEVTEEHYEKMKKNIIQRNRMRRKKEMANRKLRRERDRARKYLKTVQVMILGINLDGQVIQANRKAAEILGYDKEDILGKNWFKNFIPEEKKEELKEIHQNVGKSSFPEYYENPVLTRSEEKRTILWHNTVLEDLEGNEIGTLSTGMDITEKKEKEEKLRESKEKFRSYVENAPIGVFVVDPEGNYLEVNESACEMTGYSKKELLDMSVTDLHPPEIRQEIVDRFQELLDTGEIREELPYIRKDGSRGYWILNAVELSGERYLGFAEDITDRKEVERRKEFLNTLLRQDLGSRYQTIQGYLQLVEEAELPDKYRKYLERAIKTGTEVDEIIGLAKKLEEIEKSDYLVVKDLPKVLEHILSDISDLIDNMGVKIDIDMMDVDKVRSHYSLKTLLSQLIKVRIQTSGCDLIRIAGEKNEQEIILTLEDDGEPLPKDLKDLFAGDLYTGKTSGAGGVRYYMLREIAELTNASIEVKDSELGGAGFDVYLKKVQKEEK